MRIWRPDIVLLYCFDKKDKLINKSIFAITEDEKKAKSDEIILIALITIFLLLFFARSLTVFLVLLTSGLIIGIFGLIKERSCIKW